MMLDGWDWDERKNLIKVPLPGGFTLYCQMSLVVTKCSSKIVSKLRLVS